MAKTAEQQINKLKKKLTLLPSRLAKGSMLKVMADQSAAAIKKRTREGFGITKWLGSKKKLRITDATKKIRRSLKKAGKLSTDTSPTKANLTRSGDMLNNFEVSSSKRTLYELKPGANDLSKVRELEKIDMRFFGLTKKEYTDVKNIALDSIIREFKKLFTTRN